MLPYLSIAAALLYLHAMSLFRLLSTLALVSGFCAMLTGCGAHLNPTETAAAPVSLTGNWLLSGQLSPFPGPTPGLSLSAAVFVSGQQVSAQGYLQDQCSATAGIGGTFFVSGQMADDGTFTLTTPSLPLGSNSVQISIAGQAPDARSPSGWAGQYTITYPSGSPPLGLPCAAAQNVAFTASPLPPLSATYISGENQAFPTSPSLGPNVSLSLSIEQGAPILNALTIPGENPLAADSSLGKIPLTGTVSVSGSPCFTSGTAAGPPALGSVFGAFYSLHFTMNDGSQLLVYGTMIDNDVSSLHAIYAVIGGSCDQDSGELILNRS